ncbi:MAG TPA: glycosyltransferase [Candidatus Acidoferrales bacterium]|nr:glycosyltransferase [Candidatus Acidoferrales bacterium]
MRGRSSDLKLVILMPIFNDWEAAALLLPALDGELAQNGLEAEVILVDDASPAPPPPRLADGPFAAIKTVDILGLRRNLGHQRAIAVGLAFVEANRPCRAVVVMDGDGEDDPPMCRAWCANARPLMIAGSSLPSGRAVRKARSFASSTTFIACSILS